LKRKSNYPRSEATRDLKLAELSRKVEDNATSRELWRIPPPAGAGGFQVAGLIWKHQKALIIYENIRMAVLLFLNLSGHTNGCCEIRQKYLWIG
jgi:hypothetical protein